MNLSTLLPKEAVLPHLPARDKKQALKLLAAHAEKLTGLAERDIYGVLMEREQIGCTGVGSGVCIPHGRFEGLKQSKAIFARIDKPIEFGANDGKPVDLIFLLLTPLSTNAEHLKALALVSKLMRDKKHCKELREAGDDALHSILVSYDEDAA